MTTEQVNLTENENNITKSDPTTSWLRENFKCTIWIIVDKSNATKWCDQVLPDIWRQKRPEKITQAKVYKVINKVRNFLWLPTILPSTPFYKK
jgi:hypothetical protein